jgi:DNA-nicking Smr family endonuclease
LEPKLTRIMSRVAGIHFKLLNPDPMSLVIDLHGLSVSQACAVTTAFLRHHSKTSKMVKLVTGVGRHSEGMGKLRPAIEALIKSMNLPYESEDAAFRVYLSASRH